MKHQKSLITILFLCVLGIYLFVTAPAALPEKNQSSERMVPVRIMFEILASEQAAARAIYTREIVGPGLAHGMKFDESWKEEGVEAGPLPAVLLREVASRLQRSGTEVGLFLGSDFPISPVNKFSGAQLKYFDQMKSSGAPQFFKDDSNDRYTGMFLDTASAEGCVNCHNKHPKSSKRDWKLNDPMGATTWLYPRSEVSVDEVLARLDALRSAIRASYQAYLDRAAAFTKNKPAIGSQWPKDGMYLPDADTFMQTVIARASPHTVELLLNTGGKNANQPR